MNESDGISPATSVPLIARLRLLADRGLGVGNFLDRARAVSRAPEQPFLLAQCAVAEQLPVERLSLARLVQVRDSLAAWYHQANVGKGDPVGVYLGEGIGAFLHFLALSSLGAVPALINGRMDPVIAAGYLHRIGAVAVVADPRRRAEVEASGALPDGIRCWAASAELPRPTGPKPQLPGVFPYPHGEYDPVMLCHTSGTTGPPKAATFTHRQFFLGKRSRLVTFPAAGSNRLLSALPQSHSAGISYLMTATLLGLPTLVMADTSGEAVLRAMGEFRPTVVVAFPQTYTELAGLDLDRTATDEVHTWINTGDSAHEAHIRALIRHGQRPTRRGTRPGSRFIDGLGSSEMGMALFRRVSEPESTRYGRCVGTPVRVVEHAAVLDGEGRQLGPDIVGRLGVKTPTVTPGYWNDSVLTARSSLSGYWLTGDIVYRDRKGCFFHLDRASDVIHTSSGPVYSLPMEEAILAGCPQVADCAVIAVDAALPGHADVPFATVKLKPTATSATDVLSTLNQALAAQGQPTLQGAIIAREPADFPTGPTGKVLKRELRERFADILHRPETAPIRPSQPVTHHRLVHADGSNIDGWSSRRKERAMRHSAPAIEVAGSAVPASDTSTSARATTSESAGVPAPVRMYELLYSSLVSQLLIAIAELGVADFVGEPRHVDELAELTQSDPDALYRVLRALASVGVFTEVAPRTFGLTPLAGTLRSQAQGSMRNLARYVGLRERQQAFAGLLHSVRTGEPAFDRVHGTDWWTYFDAHPELASLFNSAMGSMARMVNSATIEAYDLSDVRRLVDVGGGQGHLVATLLQRYQDMSAVVFDLPRVAPEAVGVLADAGVADRGECVGGDFFESVPADGDAYVVSWTLHDWNDTDAITILSNIRRAMNGAGKLIVIDEVIPEGDTPHFGKFEDIVMLTLLTGRVRTEAEFVALFTAAGLRHIETRATASPTSVVVAVPA